MTPEGGNPKYAVGDRVRVIAAPSSLWTIKAHRATDDGHVYDLQGPRYVWYGVKEIHLHPEGAKDATEVSG